MGSVGNAISPKPKSKNSDKGTDKGVKKISGKKIFLKLKIGKSTIPTQNGTNKAK